jgi:ribose transport system substrate-binding protein
MLNGKGNVVMIDGVLGTTPDTERNTSAREVFSKYPSVKVIAESLGKWNQAIGRTELSKILATHPWGEIAGLIMQRGCNQAGARWKTRPESRTTRSGRASASRKQLSGPVSARDTNAPGANGAYRAMGVPGIDETLEVGFAAALVGQPEK